MSEFEVGGEAPRDEAFDAFGDERRSRRLDLRDVFYVLGLITLSVVILVFAADYLSLFVLAVFVWFIVNAIANGLKSLSTIGPMLPQWLATTLAAAITLGVIFVCGRLVVDNVATLSDTLSVSLSNLGPRLEGLVSSIEEATGFAVAGEIAAMIESLPIRQIATGVFSSITSIAGDFLLVMLFALFLLIDQRYYTKKIEALFPDSQRQNHVKAVLDRIGADTRTFIWIMTVVSIAVGVLTYAISRYFGLEGAAFWGFLAFALNYIPTFGSLVGVAVPALFALVQLESLVDVGLYVVALGLVQFVAGNLVVPYLTEDRLNLSQFVVILSLTIWGAMWGVAGLFLGVPMMMVLAIVLSQFDSTRPLAILMSKDGKV